MSRSQIVCLVFVASPPEADRGSLYSICQDFFGSIATFCESKTRFEPILLRKSRSATDLVQRDQLMADKIERIRSVAPDEICFLERENYKQLHYYLPELGCSLCGKRYHGM